jgi:hypothetical protein
MLNRRPDEHEATPRPVVAIGDDDPAAFELDTPGAIWTSHACLLPIRWRGY